MDEDGPGAGALEADGPPAGLRRQALHDAAGFYDRLARVYDRLYALPPSYTQCQARWLARLCPTGPLLDLGCGSGRMFQPLEQAGLGPLVGLDCSAGMLAQARRGHPQAFLVRADAGQGLPFADSSFQSIISLHSGLIHLTAPKAPQRLLAEALRVLRPGGLLVVELPHPCSYPRENTPGRWRSFREGISCRKVEGGLEEIRVDEQGGLRTRVRLWGLEDLRRWLDGFSRAEVHPGFVGGRFDPQKGHIMVLVARK